MNGCINPTKPEEQIEKSTYLCDIYDGYFSIGSAVKTSNVNELGDLMLNYNSITAEYEMKWDILESEKGKYDFSRADELISWAEDRDVKVRGHCLMWYSNVPEWFTEGAYGRQEALKVIDGMIEKVMTHFGDTVYVWDVVNEALHDYITADQLMTGDIYRNADVDKKHFNREGVFDWYALTGTDYIKQAFKSADRVRNELGLDELKLYYNDYSLNNPNKVQACVKLVMMLKSEGIAIDGIGMQAHYNLSDYLANQEKWVDDFENAIKTYTNLGLDVQITELDITPVSYEEGKIPIEQEVKQAEMYGKIFEICREYAGQRNLGCGRVTNVTTWGVKDSSGNVKFVFDEAGQPKDAYYKITDFSR